MDTLTVKPRLMPRSPTDLLMCLPVGLLQATVVFFGPAILIGFLADSFALGVATYAAIGVIWLALSVTKLELSADGIRFVRWLGSPKFLAWKDIRSVELTPASELIVKGWLWPIFPAREMTFSLTASGHYRFRYAEDCAYFPPADDGRFREFVARHFPNAV